MLDQNVPHQLRAALAGHDVYTAAYMGWAAIRNGRLLSLAAAEQFDVMITIDAGIEFEQDVTRFFSYRKSETVCLPFSRKSM